MADYLLPWRLADRWFNPGVPSSPVQGLSDWRRRIGFLFILFLCIPFETPNNIFWDVAGQGSVTIGLGALVTLLVVGPYALVRLNSGDAYPRRALQPVLRAARSLAVTVALGLIARSGLLLAIGPGIVLVGPWLIVLGFLMLWYCARYLFDAGEAHPLFGPLITLVTLPLATAADFALQEATRVPDDIRLRIAIWGLATSTAVALLELLAVSAKLLRHR